MEIHANIYIYIYIEPENVIKKNLIITIKIIKEISRRRDVKKRIHDLRGSY